MKFKHVLMAAAAICTLGAAQASAGSPPNIGVVALHGGAIAKTAMRHDANTFTHTYSVTTNVSTQADYKVKTSLRDTYYTFSNDASICQAPDKVKITLSARRTQYAKVSTATELVDVGCDNGPVTYYGDVYDLTKKSGVGNIDSFVSTLVGHITESDGTKYIGTIILHVHVPIHS